MQAGFSQQMLRTQARHDAHDDAMYLLERGLRSADNKSMNISAFLKETRKLARIQFMLKEELGKLRMAKEKHMIESLSS